MPPPDVPPPTTAPPDHVTGLETRGSLEAFLPRALRTAPLAAVICDVVGLKAVNDVRGFLA
ncbi:MAG: hypothetical protein EBZ59_06165, partial [Planctomycetia bacterium]|nr:hypothetical protein [Planctomycetia bacterium]